MEKYFRSYHEKLDTLDCSIEQWETNGPNRITDEQQMHYNKFPKVVVRNSF